jgi:hypothetical protein
MCLNACIGLPQLMATTDFIKSKDAETILETHIKRNDGQAVDWWVIVKPAKSGKFLYYDSLMESVNNRPEPVPMVIL